MTFLFVSLSQGKKFESFKRNWEITLVEDNLWQKVAAELCSSGLGESEAHLALVCVSSVCYKSWQCIRSRWWPLWRRGRRRWDRQWWLSSWRSLALRTFIVTNSVRRNPDDGARTVLPEGITGSVGSGAVGVHSEHVGLGCPHVLD